MFLNTFLVLTQELFLTKFHLNTLTGENEVLAFYIIEVKGLLHHDTIFSLNTDNTFLTNVEQHKGWLNIFHIWLDTESVLLILAAYFETVLIL